MSIVLYELATSRKSELDLRSGAVNLEFLLLRSTDEEAVGTALLLGTPKFFGFLQRQKVSIDPLGGGVWKGMVEYKLSEGDTQQVSQTPPPEPHTDDPLGAEFSFDTTGGTRHIMQSIKTLQRKGKAKATTTGNVNASGAAYSVGTSTGGVGNTTSGNSVYDSVAVDVSVIDMYYEFDLSAIAGAIPTNAHWEGYLSGLGHSIDVFAYNWTSGAWDAIGSVAGISGTTNGSANFGISGIDYLGQGGNAGKVRVRFYSPFLGLSDVLNTDWIRLDYTATTALVPPDYQGAIGVSKEGVAGTDIVVPKLEFSMKRNFDFITIGYLAVLHSLTGKVNSKPYFGFKAGELLFLGASGQGQTGKPVPITFKFAASQNQTNVRIVPGFLEGFIVGGWDYLWVAYEDDIDAAATRTTLVRRPVAGYVEQVYQKADFKVLGF